MDTIEFRNNAARLLPTEPGVYALCDLDDVPIYVGQSIDGIRARVRRHLTSARSDVIANRQLDVWEVAFVWAWPIAAKRKLKPGSKTGITREEMARISLVERAIYHECDSKSQVVNGTVVPKLTQAERDSIVIPERVRIPVMSEEERAARRQPARRLPRQAEHFRSLLDHMLSVKNENELRRALQAHFARLERYYHGFMNASRNVHTAEDDTASDDE